jgi:small subunit ribosomal protein S6
VLLLDLQAEEATRAKIVSDARSSIEEKGELLRHDEWGERALTYPIDKQANAEYHLLQFHASDSELLDGLDRTLRITDGVLRFRVIKLKPGVPDAPEMPAAPAVHRAEPATAAVSQPESDPAPQAETETETETEAAVAEAPVAEPAV